MTRPIVAPQQARRARTPASTAALIVIVALLSGPSHGQPSPAAIAALRVVDADTGREIALAADGDVLDLADSEARRLRLEPVGVSPETRSVAFAASDARPILVDGPTYILGATEVLEGRQGVLEVPIVSGEDDAEEFLSASSRDPERYPSGFTYFTSSDLELGYDPDHARQLVALRFTNIGLPDGAQIERAAITFTADGSADGNLALTIRGELTPDAATFPQDEYFSGSSDISRRARTNASVVWIIQEPWQNREAYTSPDLAPIVREVIALPGWQMNQTLAFILTGDGGSTYRRAFSYDGQGGTPSRVPLLEIEYRVPARTGTPPLTVPEGGTTLRVTPYSGPAGTGAAGPELQLTLVTERPTTDPVASAPDVDPPTTPTTADAPEPAVTTEPPDEPTTIPATAVPADAPPRAGTVGAQLQAMWDSEVRGTVYLDRDEAQGGSLLRLELASPAPQTLRIELRAGTCATPGDVVLRLAPIDEGERESVNRVPVPLTALRLGGFVLLASADTPLACAPIGP